MRKETSKITEEQIQRALRQFKLAGGKILHCPDQVTPIGSMVRTRADAFAGSWPQAAPIAAEAARPAPE